jgi:hypothetical protein
MDVLVQPNIRSKREPTSVGIVELAHHFGLLVAPGMLWYKDIPLTSFLNLNSNQNVPDRRPRQLLEWFARLLHEIQTAIEVRLIPHERVRAVDDHPTGQSVACW